MPSRIVSAQNIDDLTELARGRLPRGVMAYVEGGAEDQVALRDIRAAWDAVKFDPRALVDVSTRSQAVDLFGTELPTPLVVAPTAMAGLVWTNGEVALARAAAKAGIPFCVSTQSTTAIETIAAEAGGRLWFQLYWLRDRSVTCGLIERAKAAGAEALILTVDTPVPPKREYNLRNGFGIPIRPTFRNVIDVMTSPRWFWSVLVRHALRHGLPTYAHYPPAFRATILQPSVAEAVRLSDAVTWDDVAFLRRTWSGNLILKGILRPDDAVQAADHGVDGIVVSNHGGRNLDGGRPVAAALPRIADAVGDRLTVLADSGMRRGSDVVKALALGARGVLIGRAPLYGLAAAGEVGATHAIEILKDEIDRTMAFIGCSDMRHIKPTFIDEAGRQEGRGAVAPSDCPRECPASLS